ncbi:MAG: cyclic nucleotide-binding domain-containing protein [Candidatus Sumerlaeia bacterium]|nr:cyclic nucleotide-binding domain-containing protein [Candidatus Sumerlaeia bacterium]
MSEAHPIPEAERRKYAEHLAHMLVFEGLDQDFILEVAYRCHLEGAEPGDVLMAEGERGIDVFFLVDGLAGVQIESIAPHFEVGITRLGPGAAIGEMSLIDGAERSASVVAIERCVLLRTTITDIEAVTRLHPIQGMRLYRNLAAVLARRLRTMNRKVTAMMRAKLRRGAE